MMDFIGIGAQKAGTSWIYACLYEHPELCAPIKEIHFFSRPRFAEGREWYENHFRGCKTSQKRGEFSTSYLYSLEAPERIANLYPKAKLIAVLRHPVERAYSQYRNAIKAGEVPKETTFKAYVEKEPSALEQGLYAKQLQRYFKYFNREQIQVLIYEDSKQNPAAFIRSIYTFLGVDPEFNPSMLHRNVNIARTPKHIWLERIIHRLAETLRRMGLDRIVFSIKRSGLTDLIRKVNTETEVVEDRPDLSTYKTYFTEDVKQLSDVLGRDMKSFWKI